jgi:methionyl-tRNA formyltransferase
VNILFFGTSFVANEYLKELHKKNHTILVVTVPDKPVSRGQKLGSPALKVYSQEKKISFIQPENFTFDVVEKIKNFNSDVGVVVEYGKLIPKLVFNLPKCRTFNVHFSLLPKYRGAAPVQHALCSGEIETGVTSFYIDEGFDAGDVIIQKRIDIDPQDNAKTLLGKLTCLGVGVMNETIEYFKNGKFIVTPQIGEPSFAPSFKKGNGLIKWGKSAVDIYNQFRGLYIWPGVYSFVSHGKLVGKRIKFVRIELFDEISINESVGVLHSIERRKGFTVSCAVGKILVTRIQLENKSVVSAWDFVQGGLISLGNRFKV